MAVIPTYRAGVGAADLSGAYLGARRIAQEADSDAARIQLGRETLAQQAVANEMELAVKREALARQAMKQQQEAEIEKAYRETQLGLKQRELANEDAITQMRLKQAANDFAALQEYKTMVDSGVPPDAAMRRVGFGQPGFASALGGQGTPPKDTASDRNLRFKILTQQKEDAAIKFGPRSPEYQQEIDRIDSQIKTLLTVPGSVRGDSSSVSPQRFIVDPNTIPVGGSPKMFIGTPPAQQMSAIPPASAATPSAMALQPSTPQGLHFFAPQGPPAPGSSMFIGTPPTPQMDTSSLSVPATLARSTSSAPRVGDVIKGYRFKGGDPSSRTNWEKVK